MFYFSLSKQNQTGQIEHEVGEILNQGGKQFLQYQKVKQNVKFLNADSQFRPKS